MAPSFSTFNVSEFFYWELLKYIICCGKMYNANELRAVIIRAAECIINEELVNTCPGTEFRLEVCSATNGAHIKTY
jgi:hypothetical protein